MAGKLYLVATPIGNLNEMSPRAVEVLKNVNFILCEDTSHSAKLTRHFEINTPLKSYHKFSEAKTIPSVLEALKRGDNIALITDAGMPCVSDPGSKLVGQCHQSGIEVLAVGGPSAVTAAAALSGMCGEGFVFLGFLPEKQKDKTDKLSRALSSGLPVIVFCAPHNLTDDLAFIYEAAGNRKVAVIKEISKIYESTRIIELKDYAVIEPKGEFVIVIEGKLPKNPLCELTPLEHLNYYLDQGLSKNDAVKRTAADRGVPKDQIYKLTVKD